MRTQSGLKMMPPPSISWSHHVCRALGLTSEAGQRSLYDMGIYDIPIYNVANACATGSNAVFLARQFVQGGLNLSCQM